MKMGRRISAVILMLVMLVSVMPVAKAGAETETETPTIVDHLNIKCRIASPYHMYFDELGVDSFSYYSGAFETAEEIEALLKDDFGIGLKNDGTPDVVEDGKGYISVLRALAVRVRRAVIRKKWNEWFPGIELDQKEYVDEATQKANAIMKNYMKVAESASGKYLEALSDDGENWNVGLAKSGTSPYSSIWKGYAYETDLEEAWDACPVRGDVVIDLFLYPTGSDVASIESDRSDNPANYLLEVNKTSRLRFFKATYNEKGERVSVPFAGAVVKDYERNADGYFVWNGTMQMTDEEGYIDIKTSTAGYHYLVSFEEYDDGNGNIYSKSDIGTFEVPVFPKTPKVEKVKTKVKGKKKAKKKSIEVSFGMKEALYTTEYTVYNVYLSKKKKSGYKKAASTNGKKMKVTIKNKKKGTYFVKIQAVMNVPYAEDENGKSFAKAFKGDYTSPKKVVVK